MNILVTGGAGFIGSHTVAMLVKKRHNVMALDNFKTGTIENLKGVRCSINVCDVADAQKLETIFYDFCPNAVIHLAAQSAITTSLKDPTEDVRINTLGTLNVIELCKKYNAKRLVFSSTSAVYREDKRQPLFGMAENFECKPTTPYGINKLASELYIRSMFPNHLIFRYGNVYGPRQKPIGENQVIARAIYHFIKGTDFSIVGDGKQKRDFVYVDDVAFANCEAVESNTIGTYNLSTGKSTSVNEVLQFIEEIYGVRGYKWDRTKKNDPRGSVYVNNSKFRADFGISFKKLFDGLEETIKSFDTTRKQ